LRGKGRGFTVEGKNIFAELEGESKETNAFPHIPLVGELIGKLEGGKNRKSLGGQKEDGIRSVPFGRSELVRN